MYCFVNTAILILYPTTYIVVWMFRSTLGASFGLNAHGFEKQAEFEILTMPPHQIIRLLL